MDIHQFSRALTLFAGLTVVMMLTGCTHPLEVKNLRSYQSLAIGRLNQPCTIGIIPATDDIEGGRLIKGIGTSLAANSATVLLPYLPNGERKADVIARIGLSPEFRGSGWNFLINFPGFLIWVPAWHGYVYEADLSANITLTKVADSSTIDTWRVPIKLDVRHAEFDRTWTEIGWLEVGIIPLIGGICFIQYDPDVTEPLLEKVENRLGEHIARQIVDRINSSGVTPQQ